MFENLLDDNDDHDDVNDAHAPAAAAGPAAPGHGNAGVIAHSASSILKMKAAR